MIERVSTPEIGYTEINIHEQRISGSVIASLIHDNAVLSALVEQLRKEIDAQTSSAETR